jgi:hypothetical protein
MCNHSKNSDSDHQQETEQQSNLYFTEFGAPIQNVNEIHNQAAKKSKELNRIHNLATEIDCDEGSVSVEVTGEALALEIYVYEIHGSVDTLIKEFEWSKKSINCHWDENGTVEGSGLLYRVSLSTELPNGIPQALK